MNKFIAIVCLFIGEALAIYPEGLKNHFFPLFQPRNHWKIWILFAN